MHTILGIPRPYITWRFAKFFPVVKRSAPLKILATVSREYSFYYEKMESESRWKNKEQSHAPARKRRSAWEYRSLSRAENSGVTRISMNSIKTLPVQKENSIKMRTMSSVELDRVRFAREVDRYLFRKRDILVLCDPPQKSASRAVIYSVQNLRAVCQTSHSE